MAATIASHPSVTLQRELVKQMKSTRSIQEINYTLLISSVLIALTLTALLWLVMNVSTVSRSDKPVLHSIPRDVISPTADIAENSITPNFPALSVIK